MTPKDTGSGRGWAYTGAILGGLVSVAANIAHARIPAHPHAGSVLFAAFWPVFLFVAIEILSRVEWPHGWGWGLLRFGGLSAVAVFAAVVSYRHLSGLLTYYGEDTITSSFGPLAVDGLMVMATGALIATSRTRATDVAASDARSNATAHAVGASDTVTVTADVAADTDTVTEPAPTDTETDVTPDTEPDTEPDTQPDIPRPGRRTRSRTPGTDKAAAVARLHAQGGMTAAEIGRRVGLSERQVRRYLAAPPKLSAVREA